MIQLSVSNAPETAAERPWERFLHNILDQVQDTQMWMAAAAVLGRIVLIVLISRIALWVVNRTIDHVMTERDKSPIKLRTRRVQTVGRLMKNAASYTVNFIVLLLVLGEFNINLGPLLAGAGVLGLAIGFGAQSLVKDIITGFFIILEDQFAVGDVIQTGAFKGTVEMIGLRATRLRSWTGEVHIIPNGMINEVTNFSINNSIAVIDIPIAYEEKAEQAMAVIRDLLGKIEDPNLAGTPVLLGIQTMGPTEMTVRVTAEVKPNTQAAVTRVILAEVKRMFESEGLEMPYPRMIAVQRGEGKERTGGT